MSEVDAKEKRKRDFERSLAGPSVGKAGLVRDQTEINRIIAEASKVRKDEELTEKITWFRNKRDSLMQDASREKLETDADRILLEVESTRDLTQTIIHVDMDAFYASVEVLMDPSLKGKPFGYEARKFGCRSGMAGFIAKKLCPHIILVPLNFDRYIAASKSVREVLLQYDENLMMASLDEGYLNITGYMAAHDMAAVDVVSQLRAQVEEKTQLTISAGIAPNRMLAKICSDKNKPNGQFLLDFDRNVITRFMRDLPVRKIPGFGRVTERCLEGLGVELMQTCGDIYTHRAELLVMDHWFNFRNLSKAYLGIADNKVAPGKREERKSVGVERTFRDKTDNEEILAELANIAEELEKDMTTLQYAGKTVTVKYKLHTYVNKTRAQSVKRYISTSAEILPIAQELLRRELPLRIRLLGIRMSTLKDLTVPESDGIQKFFAKTSAKTREPTPEPIDLSLEDDDDELEEGDFVPPVTKDHLLGPVCPICGKALGPGTSNQDLNEHIDWCLNKDAIGEAKKRTPKKPKKDPDKKEPKGSMMAWLKGK
ncbi:uncharacterized protein MKK02DRAFT_35023 [Dioszegia hungarica]|uniref:DNA polymerase kappa n=1 Tax=Dioszegia hungarica TaxID=4972 RepID=A0AA38HEY2_9TREE|nr:uncharacterized protein MKK02DRAFT_35023 [Dioszegia hungarica]KAI9639378.1 hypothetical protein MKK02DRAFT_35023 [Dioszegia hungarica]